MDAKKSQLEELLANIPDAYSDFLTIIDDIPEENYGDVIDLIKNNPDITSSDVIKYVTDNYMDFSGSEYDWDYSEPPYYDETE